MWVEAFLLGDLVLLGPDRRIGLAVLLVKDRPLRDVDCETRLAALGKFNGVANLELEADIGDEALIGLGVEPRQVAGIRVSVRVAVRYIEQDDEIVAVGERAHAGVSSEWTWFSAPAASLGRKNFWW